MRSKQFSNNLRIHRKNAGLTQRNVADRLGLDCVDRISHWERGSATPSIVNLFRLSVLYGALPHELFGELYQSIFLELSRPHQESPVVQLLEDRTSHVGRYIPHEGVGNGSSGEQPEGPGGRYRFLGAGD